MDRKVCGDFPKFCYKGFDCVEYANSFMDEGTLCIGCLPYYRHIEDNEAKDRQDQTEGTAVIRCPGPVIKGWVPPNPEEATIWIREWGEREEHGEYLGKVFRFCASLPTVDLSRMSTTYKAIVRINDPRKLAEEIHDYHFGKGHNVLVVGRSISYTKGERTDRELTSDEKVDLDYTQKPPRFAHQCEFGIHVIPFEICPEECKNPEGQFQPRCEFIVNLGKKLDYLTLVHPR